MNTTQVTSEDPTTRPIQGQTEPDPNGDIPPNPDTGPPKG